MKRMLGPMCLAIAVATALAAPRSPLVRDAIAAEPTVATVTLHVDGMTCTSCAVTVRVALKKLDGVKDAVVSVEEKRALVTYEPSKVTPQQMVEVVNKAGYKARVVPAKEG